MSAVVNLKEGEHQLPAAEKEVVGNALLQTFMQPAVDKGHDPVAILAGAGIDESAYTNPDARINGEQFLKMLLNLEYTMQDVFFGYLALPAKYALVREQSKVRFQYKTFGEFVRASTQFREAVRNDIHYDYHDDTKHQEFTLGVHYAIIPGANQHLFYWHRMMWIYKYYCWLIGKRVKLNRVCFSDPPWDKDEGIDYYSYFNCAVEFNQPVNSISFDKKYLHYPISRTAMEEVDFVKKYPNWFSIPGQDISWTRLVEKALIKLQAQDNWTPSIDTVSEVLSVSSRTLRRQLSRENETFQGIKGRVRCELSIRLLVTSDLPITTVSGEVGFIEPGDFTRAFINWTGMSPSNYRSKYGLNKSHF